MKIVVSDGLAPSALDLLSRVEGWTVDARPGRPRDELLQDVAGADALIVRSATRVDEALLEVADRLRVVGRAGAGVDNIDLAAASARGIVVMNTPGVNSVSVAEHTWALILSVARSVPAADGTMKRGRWEKTNLLGAELRGKTLGLVGLGRVGREVATRARAFGMSAVAFDPYIAEGVAVDLGVELVSLDELCARADYVTLHLPATAATTRMFDAARLARCKRGVRLINTARGDLVDEEALADAIEGGHVAGAGLDVFESEPFPRPRLTSLPQVVATPHIAASTVEAQELVGLEIAASVRDYLLDGVIRNAVNFPSVAPEELRRLQPFLTLAERLGSLLGGVAAGRTERVGVRYYGSLATSSHEILASAVLAGLLKTILSERVTLVNARSIAGERGIEVVESRSTRPRNFTSLISVKLHCADVECWAEGTVFEHGSLRLVGLDGVDVEAPLEGSLLVIRNEDQPGVIGEVGTILGRHGINIASFALGRSALGAVGVVNVDEPEHGGNRVDEPLLAEIRRVPAVRSATIVRL